MLGPGTRAARSGKLGAEAYLRTVPRASLRVWLILSKSAGEPQNRGGLNRQYPTGDAQAQDAEDWVLGLSPRQALRKAGVLSHRFWLCSFLERDFWLPA